MAKFTSSTYPELRLDIHTTDDDRTTVQFADGVVEVSGKAADAVKKAAAEQPELGIKVASARDRAADKDAD